LALSTGDIRKQVALLGTGYDRRSSRAADFSLMAAIHSKKSRLPRPKLSFKLTLLRDSVFVRV
jgi:hypothetical protein